MRRVDIAVVLLSLEGCGTSPSPSADCGPLEGKYELSVSPLGQSENLGGMCLSAAPPQVIDIAFDGTGVVMGGETCKVCSKAGCQVNVVCGQTVVCPATVTPVEAPADSFVQTLSFVLPPPSSAVSTANALVELGPDYCAYEGTARKLP